MFRFALKHLLLATTLIAICAVALSTGTWFWTRVLFTLALAVNLGAVVAVLLLRGRQRAFWIGFAVFGWVYWLIVNYPLLRIAEHQLFASEIADMLKDYTPEANSGIVKLRSTHAIAIFSFERSIHTVFGLAFALLGGALGYWLYATQSRSEALDAANKQGK